MAGHGAAGAVLHTAGAGSASGQGERARKSAEEQLLPAYILSTSMKCRVSWSLVGPQFYLFRNRPIPSREQQKPA